MNKNNSKWEALLPGCGAALIVPAPSCVMLAGQQRQAELPGCHENQQLGADQGCGGSTEGAAAGAEAAGGRWVGQRRGHAGGIRLRFRCRWGSSMPSWQAHLRDLLTLFPRRLPLAAACGCVAGRGAAAPCIGLQWAAALGCMSGPTLLLLAVGALQMRMRRRLRSCTFARWRTRGGSTVCERVRSSPTLWPPGLTPHRFSCGTWGSSWLSCGTRRYRWRAHLARCTRSTRDMCTHTAQVGGVRLKAV